MHLFIHIKLRGGFTGRCRGSRGVKEPSFFTGCNSGFSWVRINHPINSEPIKVGVVQYMRFPNDTHPQKWASSIQNHRAETLAVKYIM